MARKPGVSFASSGTQTICLQLCDTVEVSVNGDAVFAASVQVHDCLGLLVVIRCGMNEWRLRRFSPFGLVCDVKVNAI